MKKRYDVIALIIIIGMRNICHSSGCYYNPFHHARYSRQTLMNINIIICNIIIIVLVAKKSLEIE